MLTVERMEHEIATWIVNVWQNRELGGHAPARGPGQAGASLCDGTAGTDRAEKQLAAGRRRPGMRLRIGCGAC